MRGIEKTRSVHDVGGAGQNRCQQPAILARVELQIGVLNEEDVARRLVESEPDGGALSEIDLAVVRLHSRIADPLARVDSPARAVARAIVRDDDLFFYHAEIHVEYAVDDFADRLLFVVHGDDDRQFHVARYDARTCCGAFSIVRSSADRRCTARAPCLSSSVCSSCSSGRPIRGGTKDSITIISSRSRLSRASPFRRSTIRGATRISWPRSIGSSAITRRFR